MNEAFLQLFEYSREEVIGHTSAELGSFAYPNERAELAILLQQKGRIDNLEMPFLTKTGKQVKVITSINKIRIRNQDFLVSTMIDITQRKKAEEALTDSEERLKRSQEIAHLGSWELDLENDKLTWSDEVYRIFGLRPQEFDATYEAFLSYIHPDDRSAVDCAYSGSVLEGRDTFDIDHRIIRKDTGEIRFVREKSTYIRNSEGKIIRSIGMVQDISDRKKMEDELRISEEKFSKAFMNSPNAITLTRLSDGKVIDANNSVKKILGYDLKDSRDEQRSS